ncbi:MAG: hypothetical protein AAGJ35_13400, partial [Myxococcota bacterium]
FCHCGPVDTTTRRKRWCHKFDAAIERVGKNNKNGGTPVDVQHSMLENEGEIVPYQPVYNVFTKTVNAQQREERLSYQLIIPYLERLKQTNSGSIAEYSVTTDGTYIERLFFCPNTSQSVLKWTPPVISIDACHVKGGTPSQIYAFTCLSPDHHIYILAFGIAAGRESIRTWKWMLERFKSAMPTL